MEVFWAESNGGLLESWKKWKSVTLVMSLWIIFVMFRRLVMYQYSSPCPRFCLQSTVRDQHHSFPIASYLPMGKHVQLILDVLGRSLDAIHQLDSSGMHICLEIWFYYQLMRSLPVGASVLKIIYLGNTIYAGFIFADDLEHNYQELGFHGGGHKAIGYVAC